MKNIETGSLINVIVNIGNDPVLLDAFFCDLFTPVEYTEIQKRWEIVKMLNNGIGQHKIAKDLKVGIATVTRGSRVLKDSKGGFNKILNK